MRLAVFDPVTLQSDPSGGCVVRALAAAAEVHEITVFSSALDDSLLGRVRFVKVPSISRPQVARYVSFKFFATLLWMWQRAKGRRFDAVQATETCVGFATMSYVHFCHTAYLANLARTPGDRSLRARVRRADHVLRARPEARCFARGKIIAVSEGLATELVDVMRLDRSTVTVIPNPVDIASFAAPVTFDRVAARNEIGVTSEEVLLSFVALGHFERKGLPEAISALAKPGMASICLVVVGGESDLVEVYRKRVAAAGLSKRVHFAGWQSDIRPFLWASDAFLLPSRYESFSLALHQAGAASLPLIATEVHGAKELIRDGEQGILVPTEAGTPQLSGPLRRFLEMTQEERRDMGSAARKAVEPFDAPRFLERWLQTYDAS